jgi:hypothetical protein
MKNKQKEWHPATKPLKIKPRSEWSAGETSIFLHKAAFILLIHLSAIQKKLL